MNPLVLLRLLALLVAFTTPPAASAAPAVTTPAGVELMNREVAVLRGTLGDAGPAQRAERARARFDALTDAELATPARLQNYVLGEARGYAVMIGATQLFSLLNSDLDPLDERPLDTLAQATLQAVQTAQDARRHQRYWPNLLIGIALSLLATGLLAAILFGLARLWRRLTLGLATATRARLGRKADARDRLGGFALRFAGNIASLLRWIVLLSLVYAWAVFVLERFALTRPLGERLGELVIGALASVAHGAVSAAPDLVTLAVVLFLTRATADVVGQIFESVQSGQLQLPFVHPETAGATRRIVTTLVWGLGVAFAYPYIPGSSSEAFKGLSVLFGVVISLGSTGIMTQMMSGLVVVYSRALRKGDYVSVNEVEGVVTEVGALATKIMNVRNEEITVPNGVLIGSPIHNFSKNAGTQGSLLSTGVTIGYDTPWRQVHAMLLAAAAATEGIRRDPAPIVYQRALSDFYVEYELLVHVDQPMLRVRILSQLHAAIQDQFNEHGVQIMSPHFFDQPAEAVVVPKARWFAAPAQKG